MYRTFNCGIGMVAIVPPEHAQQAVELLDRGGESRMLIGEVAPRRAAAWSSSSNRDRRGPRYARDPDLRPRLQHGGDRARRASPARIPRRRCVVIADRHDARRSRRRARMGLHTRCRELRRGRGPRRVRARRSSGRLAESVARADRTGGIHAHALTRHSSSDTPAGCSTFIRRCCLDYRGLHTHRRVLEAGDHAAWRQRALRHRGARWRTGDSAIAGAGAARRYRSDACSARSATEHIIYPRVIGWLADGSAWLDGRPLTLDGRPLETPSWRICMNCCGTDAAHGWRMGSRWRPAACCARTPGPTRCDRLRPRTSGSGMA